MPKRRLYTANVVRLLKRALSKHQYPSTEIKLELVKQTNLSLQQINNWFVNARHRYENVEVDENEVENVENVAVDDANANEKNVENVENVNIPTFVEREEDTWFDDVIARLICTYFDDHAFDILDHFYHDRLRRHLSEVLVSRTRTWRQLLFVMQAVDIPDRSMVDKACQVVLANTELATALDLLYFATLESHYLYSISILRSGLLPLPLDMENGFVLPVTDMVKDKSHPFASELLELLRTYQVCQVYQM